LRAHQQQPALEGGSAPRVGILLVNLGTPEAPTTRALRSFLREFLGDPRVVERPRWLWWPVLNLFILPLRPRRSAALYRKIWAKDGSPLLSRCRSLLEALATHLEIVAPACDIALGMRYGQPSIERALRELRAKGCAKLLIVPLFPQYSGTTVGSVFDAVAREIATWRVVPALRMIDQYHDAEAYIDAIAETVRETWVAGGEPDQLLFSFHGLPQRYVAAGDPYAEQCRATARLVAGVLGLPEERYRVSFQSVFGSQEWTQPNTLAVLGEMPGEGIEKVDVICPGFSVDCLETLEEIDQTNRQRFLDNGGALFRYIPCLNDRPEHARLLMSLLRRELEGWVAMAPHRERPAGTGPSGIPDAEASRQGAERRMSL